MQSRSRQLAEEYLSGTLRALRGIDLDTASEIADILLQVRLRKARVFVIGNGGSASTASHMAVVFSKTSAGLHGSNVDAIALTDNVAVLTAIANDVEFDRIFSDQVARVIAAEDVLIAISASGCSRNIILAAESAKAAGAIVVALTGFGGGELVKYADLSIVIDSSEFGPVEDGHLILNHLLTHILRSMDD